MPITELRIEGLRARDCLLGKMPSLRALIDLLGGLLRPEAPAPAAPTPAPRKRSKSPRRT